MSHAFDQAWAVLKAEPFSLERPRYEEQGIPQPGWGPSSRRAPGTRRGIVDFNNQETELPQLGGIARLAGQLRNTGGLRGMLQSAHTKFGDVTGMDTPQYRFRDVSRMNHPYSAYPENFQGEKLELPPNQRFGTAMGSHASFRNPSLNTASTTGLNQAEMQQRQQKLDDQQRFKGNVGIGNFMNQMDQQQQQQQQQQMMQSTPNPMQWAM